jgi:hypothetical protein
MGDLTKGETFAAGEVVTAARLHALVENATINPDAVGTAEIADGAVTGAKLDPSLELSTSWLQLASGKTVIGNGSGIANQVTVDTGTMQITPTLAVKTSGIAATQLASDAVVTAKILDGNVTGAKLETLSPSPAGSYGSATIIPRVTVDAKGRVTAVTTNSLALRHASVGGVLDFPTSPIVICGWPWPVTSAPTHFEVSLVCKNNSTAGGWKIADVVSVEALRAVAGGPESFCGHCIYYDFTAEYVYFKTSSAVSSWIIPGKGAAADATFTPADWSVDVRIFY